MIWPSCGWGVAIAPSVSTSDIRNGVVAIDGAGNRGQVSNLVRIYIREVTTTTDIGMTFRWGNILLLPYCDLL